MERGKSNQPKKLHLIHNHNPNPLDLYLLYQSQSPWRKFSKYICRSFSCQDIPLFVIHEIEKENLRAKFKFVVSVEVRGNCVVAVRVAVGCDVDNVVEVVIVVGDILDVAVVIVVVVKYGVVLDGVPDVEEVICVVSILVVNAGKAIDEVIVELQSLLIAEAKNESIWFFFA
jgi:hypothetical protein